MKSGEGEEERDGRRGGGREQGRGRRRAGEEREEEGAPLIGGPSPASESPVEHSRLLNLAAGKLESSERLKK